MWEERGVFRIRAGAAYFENQTRSKESRLMKIPSLLVAVFVTAFSAMPALAQYPAKPIRVVVPFPPGSATDTVTRILGRAISANVAQSVIRSEERRVGKEGRCRGEA